MVRRNTRTVGNVAEELAFQYLRARGLHPVERNYRCRLGEIDLIMLDKGCLVFVEVRFRSSGAFSGAAATVDTRKQGKLVRTAEIFLASRAGLSGRTARFDVVGIDGRANGRHRIEWIRDAFGP